MEPYLIRLIKIIINSYYALKDAKTETCLGPVMENLLSSKREISLTES